jgi:hypothetical protein
LSLLHEMDKLIKPWCWNIWRRCYFHFGDSFCFTYVILVADIKGLAHEV